MKIGIITIHNSSNYGACLQSWGLYKYLVDMGYECEIIDLHRPMMHKDYVFSEKYIDYYGKCIEAQKFDLKRWAKGLIGRYKTPTAIKRREQKFNMFNERIRLSKPYKGIDELYSKPPLYDIYITGSDQVWNPTQPYCVEPYFLTFVNAPNAKKISYAPSIGIETLSDKEKSDFKKWLETYDVISVREHEGKQLLESFVDKKIYQVADPTFLLGPDYWRSIAVKPKVDEPYILCFKLYGDNNLVEYASKIASQSGKKVIVLPGGKDYTGKCQFVEDAGPEEFLGYIANADMLISDSFHANVFALLLGVKNQWAYIRPTNKRGSRIVTLFDTFGLSSHFIKPDLSTTYDELNGLTIDTGKTYKIAMDEMTRSRDFLNKAISGGL